MGLTPLSQGGESNTPHVKPRLVLHAGTTKTGSTALQVFLHKFRGALIDNGVLYPGVGIEPNSVQPKHQWIVQNLLSVDESLFFANQDLILAELSNHPSVHTVVLSTEGLYNHWWDFSDAAKSLLRRMDRLFDVTVWVVFREPLSFAKSLYGQVVKNPKNPLIPCYGTPDPLGRVIDDPSFSRNLRYADFVRSVEALFGSPVVLATKYEDADIIDQAIGILGIDPSIAQPVEKKDLSLSETGLALARRLNRLNIDPAERKRYIDMIREIDSLLGKGEREPKIPAEFKSRVEILAKESREYLETRYQIVWD